MSRPCLATNAHARQKSSGRVSATSSCPTWPVTCLKTLSGFHVSLNLKSFHGAVEKRFNDIDRRKTFFSSFSSFSYISYIFGGRPIRAITFVCGIKVWSYGFVVSFPSYPLFLFTQHISNGNQILLATDFNLTTGFWIFQCDWLGFLVLCDHTNSLLSNCHWLFCLWSLLDNSLKNQAEKVVLYTGTVNNLCRVEEMREK